MTARWDVPDPAAAKGSASGRPLAFTDACRMLELRISFFANLPLDRIDRLKLKEKLEEIGQDKG